MWEGYRRGRRAKWLSGEDYLQLLHEPIEAARARLGLTEPVAYLKAQRALGPELASYLSQRTETDETEQAAADQGERTPEPLAA